MPLLLDGRWYTSKATPALLGKMFVIGNPHLTPDGKAVMVFDRGGLGSTASTGTPTEASPVPAPPCLVPQATDGCTLNGKPLRDLMTVNDDDRLHRIELDPALIPDLERLIEFDHLPEARQSGALEAGLHNRGDKLAMAGM